jgi:hypothetical protein
MFVERMRVAGQRLTAPQVNNSRHVLTDTHRETHFDADSSTDFSLWISIRSWQARSTRTPKLKPTD